jgi:phage terminase large subunit GpA-like protein
MADFVCDEAWLEEQFAGLSYEIEVITPSEWAETKRYLPPSVTALPGPFSFDVAPFAREIVDCMSVDSPIRECVWMKGVQITATTSGLENTIGYVIEHVKTAPMMLVTADAELAKIRLESYILPMLEHSGLAHLIRSSDEKNNRKTGKRDGKLEWVGGGFLTLIGAKNPSKMRSISARYLLNDEVDAWPLSLGSDGDPMKLVRDRTAAYESSRKIFSVSTPTVKGRSIIEREFLRGDQRYYFVSCLSCGFPQVLRWRHTNKDTGVVSGIVWDMDEGRLVPGSTRYLCEACGHAHTNDDKTKLLSPSYGAEWRPTATPVNPTVRSYHLSALYSPVGMQSWDACVEKWLEAWDDEKGQAKSHETLQVFYNNVLGETFAVLGDRVRFDQVSQHRRHHYRFGQIPNAFASEYCGGPVLLLTAAVDVHKDNLAVAVFGWTRDRRVILVDYWRFEGDAEDIHDAATWGRLRELIEEKEYRADDGKIYRVELTIIDSGYRADDVYQFCAEYASGVLPAKGREIPPKSHVGKHYELSTNKSGQRLVGIYIDHFKDRWSQSFRREWDGVSIQPEGYFNAPVDIRDDQLKELTAEVKRDKKRADGTVIGKEWHRPSGAKNELWDCLVYCSAALQIIADDVCLNQLGLEQVNWPEFYRVCSEEFVEHGIKRGLFYRY